MNHKHEWMAVGDADGIAFSARYQCSCGEILSIGAVKRRLKATECLSAEHCREICDLTEELAKEVNELLDGNISVTVKKDDPLLQYARLMEGKDD